MAALASSHRQAGDLPAAAALYEELYALNDKHSGATNQSAVRPHNPHNPSALQRPGQPDPRPSLLGS